MTDIYLHFMQVMCENVSPAELKALGVVDTARLVYAPSYSPWMQTACGDTNVTREDVTAQEDGSQHTHRGNML